MKYRPKVEGEQVITLQMAKRLKTKNINVIQGQLLCRQCKAKFLLGQRLIVLMMKKTFNLLQILTMDSLKSSNQLEFHLSVYTQCLSTAQ